MSKPEVGFRELPDLAAMLVPGSARPYPMSEGLQSRVYGVDAGTEQFVLRVCRDRAGFDKDAYAAATFAGPGLPIPEVVAVGEFGSRAYCLSRRLPGTPVNQIAADALPPVIESVEQALHAVWVVDVKHSTGFGMFDGAGDGAFATWREYLLDPIPAQVAAARSRVPMRLATGLRDYIAARRTAVPQAGACCTATSVRTMC